MSGFSPMVSGKRIHEIKLKLDKSEREKLEKKASEYGLKVSQYIRLISLNAIVRVEPKRKK